MSFLSASNPKSQLLAWTGVAGAGLVFYIYTKGKTSDKRKRDLELQRTGPMPGTDANGLPTRRRGGVGVSNASAHYRQPTPASSSSSLGSSSSAGTVKPESAFLPVRPRTYYDAPPTLAPLSLAEYRAAAQRSRMTMSTESIDVKGDDAAALVDVNTLAAATVLSAPSSWRQTKSAAGSSDRDLWLFHRPSDA